VRSKGDIVDEFIDNFAPAGNMDPFAEVVPFRYPSFFNMQFKLHELEDLISSARQGSAPGSNLINYTILKALPSIAVQILLDIFNKILRENNSPDKWREYDIVLLPKRNKTDYRSIALSSCVLKLLEKLIKVRFDRFVELDLLFPPSQFGFRKGKSCDDCLSILLLEVHKGFLSIAPCALFLDIKRA